MSKELLLRSASASPCGFGKARRKAGVAAGLVVFVLSLAALASPLILTVGATSGLVPA